MPDFSRLPQRDVQYHHQKEAHEEAARPPPSARARQQLGALTLFLLDELVRRRGGDGCTMGDGEEREKAGMGDKMA